MVEMKSKHIWIRVQEPNDSVKFYTRIRGMIDLSRSKIEKATGSFETLIRLLSLMRMIREPLGSKLDRSWYSHAAEHHFQTSQVARRAISESQAKSLASRAR